MNSFTKRCGPSFEAITRLRGLDYFQSGNVKSIEAFDQGVKAVVEGTSSYKVAIFWGDIKKNNSILASCTCPYFKDLFLCKHIWSVMLKVDDEGLSWLLTKNEKVKVVHASDAEKQIVKSAKLRAQEPKWLEHFQLAQLESDPKPGSENVQIKIRGRLIDKSKLYYTLDKSASEKSKINVNFYYLTLKTEFNSKDIYQVTIRHFNSDEIQDPLDKQALSVLFGTRKPAEDFNYFDKESFSGLGSTAVNMSIDTQLAAPVLYALVNTNRFFSSEKALRDHLKDPTVQPLTMEFVHKSNFELFVLKDEDKFRLQCRFRDLENSIGVNDLDFFSPGGLFLSKNRFYQFTPDPTTTSWVEAFKNNPKKFIISKTEAPLFLQTVLNSNTTVVLPDELTWPTDKIEPKVRALFYPEVDGNRRYLLLRLEFDYGLRLNAESPSLKVFVDAENKRIFERNLDIETQALAKMSELGAETYFSRKAGNTTFKVPVKEFTSLVEKCIEYGWAVEAEGKKLKRATKFDVKISSGLDWFGLDAKADFGGISVSLAALLDSIQKKEEFIALGDGTFGMLPYEWLEKYSSLASVGEEQKGVIKFKNNQGLLLDAWLAEEKNIVVDASFKKFREKIKTFEGIKFQKEPETFKGKLRPYQREGLSWFDFLEEFGFGGILADDMGLGKTIQCLAFFEKRRLNNKGKKNLCLVVAPKSLIFNWMDEASKFTPELRLLNYTGNEREALFSKFNEYDIIVTTYQTLRIDIEKLRKILFDCAVIDEAQAIKNDGALISKAVKLIKARFKLAMTGTPIENSLSDLFSIIEFTNPGFLGHKAFDKLFLSSGEAGPSEESLKSLSVAVKPFILRRTKTQVLKDLPEKSEQIISIELSIEQRKFYDELKDFYRVSLTKQAGEEGIEKMRIQVLTALLRLRQAALHPGLVDKARLDESSAKLDALIYQLHEIKSEGHKALVFSQFTSFLSIVKNRLIKEGIGFEYIDGKTADRKEAVEKFKKVDSCQVFLLSLKAGGVGLNLTEADYVFLLDPWWNPAVEAQAIDRAHRIGQNKKVFAYKFIAKDTVEEKILELQKSKRVLSESVIATDKTFLKNMTAQDLQNLLS